MKPGVKIGEIGQASISTNQRCLPLFVGTRNAARKKIYEEIREVKKRFLKEFMEEPASSRLAVWPSTFDMIVYRRNVG